MGVRSAVRANRRRRGDHDETSPAIRPRPSHESSQIIHPPSTLTTPETPLEASHSLVSSCRIEFCSLGVRRSVQCVRCCEGAFCIVPQRGCQRIGVCVSRGMLACWGGGRTDAERTRIIEGLGRWYMPGLVLLGVEVELVSVFFSLSFLLSYLVSSVSSSLP